MRRFIFINRQTDRQMSLDDRQKVTSVSSYFLLLKQIKKHYDNFPLTFLCYPCRCRQPSWTGQWPPRVMLIRHFSGVIWSHRFRVVSSHRNSQPTKSLACPLPVRQHCIYSYRSRWHWCTDMWWYVFVSCKDYSR